MKFGVVVGNIGMGIAIGVGIGVAIGVGIGVAIVVSLNARKSGGSSW